MTSYQNYPYLHRKFKSEGEMKFKGKFVIGDVNPDDYYVLYERS